MTVASLLAAAAAEGVQLWVEGSRLRFRAPRGALSAGLRAALRAQRPAVVRALRDEASASVRLSPLSFNQRALWFIAQEAPDSAAYNLSTAMRIGTPVDPATIREALQALTDRHAMLRTTYVVGEDGQPMQRTPGAIDVSFDVHQVPGLSDDEVRQRVEADCARPFDLARGPLFRPALYTRGAADHVLASVVHHIAADAWSLGILAQELALLQQEAAGAAVVLPTRAPREYADYVLAEEAALRSLRGERLATYWQARLAPPVTPMDLPSDRPRPARKSTRGATRIATLPAEQAARLRELARAEGASLYVVLFAAFDAMLFRLTGTADVTVGTPILGRDDESFSRVVGYFATPVPIRVAVLPGMTFRQLVGAVRSTIQGALAHQGYPLSLMVQRAHVVRDVSRSPLFDTFFTFLSSGFGPGGEAGVSSAPMGDLQWAPFQIRRLEGQFDLSMQVADSGRHLDLECRYSTDLFDTVTAEGVLTHYMALLDSMTNQLDSPLEALGHPRDQVAFSAVDATAPRPEPVETLLADLEARDVRITVDGDKLKVNAPPGVLDAEIKAVLALRKEDIVAALRACPRGDRSASSPASGAVALRPVPRTEPLPISFAQQRLWFLERMQPGNHHYNIGTTLRLYGPFDRGALATALDALIRRHEVLRTGIRDENGIPRAYVRDTVPSAVTVVDLTSEPAADRASRAAQLIQAHRIQPFDLATGPMARFLLVRLADEDHILLITMHHIAADGWSLGVAVRELQALYESDVSGAGSPLLPLAIQYMDYAAWQRQQVNAALLVRQLSYWQHELADAPAALELPTDRPRPSVQTFRGTVRHCPLAADLREELEVFSRRHDVTLYMTLLAGWQVLLHRYSGQDDIIVGSPLANRDRPELEPLIGCFVNNVVLRGRLHGNPRFVDYLAQVKGTVLRAFDHRELPFDRLVEALRPERNMSHTPVFQVLFTLHSFRSEALLQGPRRIEVVPLDELGTSTARFDLSLDLFEQDEELRSVYEFSTDLFDSSTIDRMHTQYLTLLRGVVDDAGQTVRELPLLSETDQRELLDRVNATAVDHDRTQRLHDMVRDVAERRPQQVAVQAEDEVLTYEQLEHRSNQLAHLLRARGVARGALVGVCLDRTSCLPVALLGVLKSGAAYVPVDPAHPVERLTHTLRDAQVACVITEQRFTASVEAVHVPLVLVDDDRQAMEAQPIAAPVVDGDPADLAYVIYTSGSTGQPKGVEVEHRQLVNLLRGMQTEPGMTAADVLLAVTTPSFDIAGLELFLPLVVGGRTVMAARADTLDGQRLRARLEACGATIMQATPATWRLLIDAGWQGRSDLTVLCGGEVLPRDLARELTSRARAVWNMYGPTETTVWSTVHLVSDIDRDIPIGHPIANTTVYVLDAGGRPVPIGVTGELWIGGEGVARGYRQRDELTAAKFQTVSVAGRPPQRLYRTGDIVRLRADLTLEYLGRRDHQVKLRGYRIELGEIESVLAEQPAVARAMVVVREDAPGDRRLVAYLVPAMNALVDEDALRVWLRTRLPDYMVPSALVTLDALPLTANGKVDRNGLPVPVAQRRAAALSAQAVMTDTQRRVAGIWATVLKTEHVGLTENFFDLGGHSLLVIQVQAALTRAFGVQVTVVDLFQRSTVAAQAEWLDATVELGGTVLEGNGRRDCRAEP